MADVIAEIKKLLKEEKLIFGQDTTVKGLRQGTIDKVFLCSNCDDITSEDIKHYAKIAGVEIIDLEISNEELGDVCKRPHNIKVLGVKK
ncbi:hypothetical protein HN587_01950 [Candidatus Woesearchaeota archaeon]|jgi:ribosomal protein L30E|nr:hypothetical protein [Candidatus Woesearchaeota archaeon]